MSKAFQFLTIGIFSILILPWLIQDGMFMDGMIYATVARNLSLGIGSWWDLHLTNFLSGRYLDQPPLTIWITSFFFKVFGYSMYTERIYSFTTAIINLLLIKAIWQKVNFKNEKYKEYWWLPVLLWIIPPVSFWTFTNNLQENTMGIFILSSVYFMFDCIQRDKNKIVPLALMTICIFLAAMCKGIQGTFTITGLLIFAIVADRSFLSPAIKFTLISGVILSVFAYALYLYPPSREYFTGYFYTRILRTFTSPEMATTDNRFYLLFRLLTEEITPVALCLIAIIVSGKAAFKNTQQKENNKYSLFFILIALAGTLPLLVTTEQRRFYLAPVFPYYALALSFFIIESVVYIFERIKSVKIYNSIRYLGFGLLALTLILTIINTGTIKRDKEMLHDVYKIGSTLEQNSVIGIYYDDLYSLWILHLYFQRYYSITLDAGESNLKRNYFLTRQKTLFLPEWSEQKLGLQEFKLFKKPK